MSFARAIASSSVLNDPTDSTGPNIYVFGEGQLLCSFDGEDSNLFFNLKKAESIRRIKFTLKNLLTDNFHVLAYVGKN